MANTAVVGALRATLALDTAAFESGSKKAVGLAGALGGKLQKALAPVAIGAAVAASLAAVGAAIKSVIDKADQLAQVSQKIGITVEELSKLEYVAKLSDVSIEGLTGAFGRLARIQQAALAGTKSAQQTFTSLGITLEQLRSASPSQLLALLADKFAALKDGAQQSDVAIKLFGKSLGLEMIPLLNQGSQELTKLTDQARRFGQEISTTAAVQADRFNDNLQTMQSMLSGIFTRVAERLLPTLVELTNRFIEWADKIDLVNVVGRNLTVWVSEIIVVFKQLSLVVFTVGEALSAVNRAWEAFGTGTQLDIWEKAMESIRAQARLTTAEIAILRLEAQGIGGRFGATGGGNIPKSTGAGTATLADSDPFKFSDAKTNIIDTRKELEKLKPISEEIISRFEGLGASIADVFFDMADGTKSLKEGFKDLFENLLRDLIRLMASRAMQAFISAFLGPSTFAPGVGPGGMGYTHFGGPRQHGGRVRRGGAYLVGERGAEMFVPRTSGQVVPNSAMGGGVSIKIVDQRSTSAPPVQSRQGSDGSTEFIIRDTIRKQLPSELNRLMPSQFGAKPRLAQRGS